MGRRVDQRALVVLAVDLDQRPAQRLQRLHAHRLVVDEGAGAAVGELHAAQDQLVLGRDVVCGHERARRMVGRRLERRGHLPLLGALAHQRDVAARAERQREGIEQDRLAGAGLAGEHGQAGGEIDVEPVDQDDVANREPGQHAWLLKHVVNARTRSGHPRLRDSPSSKTRMAGTSPGMTMWVTGLSRWLSRGRTS